MSPGYLAGLSDNQVDAATLGKILEIQALAEADRRHIMTTIDALLGMLKRVRRMRSNIILSYLERAR